MTEEEETKQAKLKTIGIILACVAMTPYALWKSVPDLLEGKASEKWTVTEGQVLSAKVIEGGKEDKPTYSPSVTFQFEVYGQPQKGERINVGKPQVSSEGWVRGELARYPVGSTVKVYYPPNNPSAAVLQPGVPNSAWWVGGLGAGLGLVAVVNGVVLARGKKG